VRSCCRCWPVLLAQELVHGRFLCPPDLPLRDDRVGCPSCWTFGLTTGLGKRQSVLQGRDGLAMPRGAWPRRNSAAPGRISLTSWGWGPGLLSGGSRRVALIQPASPGVGPKWTWRSIPVQCPIERPDQRPIPPRFQLGRHGPWRRFQQLPMASSRASGPVPQGDRTVGSVPPAGKRPAPAQQIQLAPNPA